MILAYQFRTLLSYFHCAGDLKNCTFIAGVSRANGKCIYSQLYILEFYDVQIHVEKNVSIRMYFYRMYFEKKLKEKRELLYSYVTFIKIKTTVHETIYYFCRSIR